MKVLNENNGTEASDDRLTESKRTEYTDATKDVEITRRANVTGLNKSALEYFKKELGKNEKQTRIL